MIGRLCFIELCAIIPPPVWSFAILRSKLYCGWWRRSFCPSICFDGDGWSVAGSGDDEDDNGKKKDKKEDDKNGWNIRMRTFSKMGIKKFMISNKEGVSRAEWKSLFISDPVGRLLSQYQFQELMKVSMETLSHVSLREFLWGTGAEEF